MTGHTKENCTKLKLSIEDRKCNICNKTSHIGNKDKATRPTDTLTLMAQSGPGTAIVPYRNRAFLGVVTDEEGYQ